MRAHHVDDPHVPRGWKLRYARLRAQKSVVEHPITVATMLALVIASIALGLVLNEQKNLGNAQDTLIAHDDDISEIAAENKALVCSISRLISYVPAIQFDGEPISNFMGWINARHDMLEEVRDRKTCSEHVEELLVKRVRLDEKLLATLRAREP